MAETNGLLNRRTGFTRTEGSNPSRSAIFLPATWFEGSLMVFWATRCAMKGEPWKTASFSCTGS